ncbi:MAG: membrane protein insertion efficiency factor YidD [Bdellovibrionales bacterium CG12_big_fil_rev_8_21_14_0_65_38_15]|nr:MAG: membrane protein insertion efficiency factor YidD [Bdellovibrionales bacterium CG22_combo_CG10-13_8_21_14_all_38_13]PIQ53418.1 MAG: membrane protein insertion efficiency factor YidD [Bdellovibrionales bacterium CG12_big_fil_rev_8_21_14_0_65_38_15]PIR30219.1 MAG: membrane protein insertion efficiency factor YidD [Bdellovibrionales bacterium CG11_big_fil_rev_8_21_14_0_20_38_13]
MVKRFCLSLIRIYQLTFSVVFGAFGVQCRFYPTCSHYAQEALGKYSIPKALRLIVCRVLKCHPFHPGGIDHP